MLATILTISKKAAKEEKVADVSYEIDYGPSNSLGLLSVATLVSETNGFEGLEDLRQLVSFAGYDVVENPFP